MKIVFSAVLVAQLVFLVWVLSSRIRARKRHKQLIANIEQELQRLEVTADRLRRATDPSLTPAQATALMTELRVEQIMREQREQKL